MTSDTNSSEAGDGASERAVLQHIVVVESKIDRLVPHVLQLENAALLIVGVIVLLQVLNSFQSAHPNAEITGLFWFVPYAALLLAGWAIRIRNPYNRFAEAVETGFSYASAGALAGGSATGLLDGGLTAVAGGAIGGVVGFCVGLARGASKTANKKPDGSLVDCRHCDAEIRRTDQYCEDCGGPQKSGRTCKDCGRQLSPQANFCPACGSGQLDEHSG